MAAVQKTRARVVQSLPKTLPQPRAAWPPKPVTPYDLSPMQFIPRIDMLGNNPTSATDAPGAAGGAGSGLPSFAAPQQPEPIRYIGNPYLVGDTGARDVNLIPVDQPTTPPSPGVAPVSTAAPRGNPRIAEFQKDISGPPMGWNGSAQGWNPEDVLDFSPELAGTLPDFGGGSAASFAPRVQPSMIPAPQQQYDPQRAQEIMKALSFMPLVSLLGGDFGYAQRLMPNLAANAIAGDKARFDEGQVMNQRFMTGAAQANQNDIANQFEAQKLGQQAAEEFTKRAVARSSAAMAQQELLQKNKELQERALNNMRGSEAERVKVSQEYQAWLSQLTPEAQIAFDARLTDSFRAFWGVGLPRDEKGNPVPLQRANPNDPSQRMVRIQILNNLIDEIGKNPENQTPQGQQALLMQINALMSELDISPESMFTAPLTTNQSPTQKATLGLRQAELAVDQQRAATDRQRAAIYGQSVQNQFKLGMGQLSLREREQKVKEAAAGAFGPQMKMAAAQYNAAQRTITAAAAKINQISGARYDSMLGRLVYPNAEAEKKNAPLVAPFLEQLQQGQRMSNYYNAILMQGLAGQAGAVGGGAVSPMQIPEPPVVSTSVAPPPSRGAVDPDEEELKKLLQGG